MTDFKSTVKTILESKFDDGFGPYSKDQEESFSRQSDAMKKNAGKSYAEIMADALHNNPQFKGDFITKADLIQSKTDEHNDPAFQEHMKKLMKRLRFN
jgi:hypothetical protein